MKFALFSRRNDGDGRRAAQATHAGPGGRRQREDPTQEQRPHAALPHGPLGLFRLFADESRRIRVRRWAAQRVAQGKVDAGAIWRSQMLPQ